MKYYQQNSDFLNLRVLLHKVENIPSVQSLVATSSRPNIWGAVIACNKEDWKKVNTSVETRIKSVQKECTHFNKTGFKNTSTSMFDQFYRIFNLMVSDFCYCGRVYQVKAN